MKKLILIVAVLFTSLSLAVLNTGSQAHAAATHAQVTIQNFAFSPSSISVQKGSTVTWTNRDNTAHTVTGNTSGGPASGHIQPGKSYSFTFNSAGTFPYHCAIHPEMTGKVTVTNSPANPSATTKPATTPKSTSSMGSMPMNTDTQKSEQSEYQKPPTQLPNTGSSQTIPLFAEATAAGMTIYYLILYFLKKIS